MDSNHHNKLRWDQSPGTPRKPHLNPLVGTPAASHGESLGESLGKSLGESLGESLGKSLGESHARMDMNWTQWRRTCCRNTHQIRPSQRITGHHSASQGITAHRRASQRITTNHMTSQHIATRVSKETSGVSIWRPAAACSRCCLEAIGLTYASDTRTGSNQRLFQVNSH